MKPLPTVKHIVWTGRLESGPTPGPQVSWIA